MKTRLLDLRAWVVFLFCLNSTACFHSLDDKKVRCTSSDHCPSNDMCLAGTCVSRSTTALDGGGLDTRVVGTVDSSVADGAGLHGDVASLGSDADAPAVVSTPDTSASDLSDDLSFSDTSDVPLLGTGGVGGAGGVPGSGGRGGSTGGAPGSGGVIGAGGIVGTGGSGAAAGGISGTGGGTTQPNYCAGQTCSGHGTCVGGTTGYTCTCNGGWSGVNCQVDPCSGITCSGHGTCSGSGICTCTGGWSGTSCSVDPCSGMTCNGHGTCSAGACTCTGGWGGSGCTIDPCSGMTCNGHGTCSAGACTCTGGWGGSGCTIDPCLNVSCSGHGSCSGGTCTCNTGWSPPNCATAIPPTLTGVNDITMCNSSSQPNAVFTVSASGAAGGPYSYQWYTCDDLSGSNPQTQWNEATGTTTSTLTMYLQGRGSPTAPNKYYYYVVVTDPNTGASAKSRIATLWLAQPDPFYIQYHDDSLYPKLSVQIDVPPTGCITYSFVNDGSTNFPAPLGQVCAGMPTPQWVYVGNVNTDPNVPDSYNKVRTTVVVQANGLTCTSSYYDWEWPGR